MIDLSDPTNPLVQEQLRRKTAEGRYEIHEIELVKAIRVLHRKGDHASTRVLAEVLLLRCLPAFQKHSQGLRHRPDLREEAIANMSEHLLREALDSKEVFMTQNFVHYLRCLCADEFNRVLRQEGLYYRRDEEGRPSGRPQHVPQALIDPIRPVSPDDDSFSNADVADPNDEYEQLHAEHESQRILTYLQDPLDRTIMVLRAIEGMKWDDIAVVCKRTERTVRTRYERARRYLGECIVKEQQRIYIPVVQPQ
jgi:DNA-directed RNA polymerase specialized sigma24 family protein